MRHIVNLNRKWAFTKSFGSVPEKMPDKWCFVNLPHTWNDIDGQDGGNDYYRGKCCYARMLYKNELPSADKYYLEIKGANSVAEVFVDGRSLCLHKGGYSTFRVDITESLKNESLLCITVDNSEDNEVYPQMADFTFYGGLYRDVNLICVGSSHFDLDYYGGPGIKITPVIKDGRALVTIEGYIITDTTELMFSCSIKDKQDNTVFSGEVSADNGVITAEIINPHLWQARRDPYLYCVTAQLKKDGRVVDEISSSFGIRSFFIDPDKGFILNGEEYPLRGVSRHQDRWGKGNALTPDDHLEDMKLIYEMGANTVRLAHYQHDSFFYDLCDQYGMVVWAEIPYISKHMPRARENTLTQMKELITQCYNHPSIVVWGLSNEITMNGASDENLRENHRLLNDLCHSLDNTRLTTIACVSMCDINDPYIKIPDVISYNHYFGWYGGDTSMNGPWLDKFHSTHPHIAIGVSEYGCEGLDWHSSTPTQGDYTEEYQAYYHQELIKQLFTRKYLWATHVWNMFDFGADARNEGGENGQNHKGLVTFDRKYKKDAFYAYKAWLSDEAFVHICGKRYIDRADEKAEVTVYSNLPEVELFANGKSLGKQKAEDHFFRFSVANTAPITRLVARADQYTDESLIRRVDTFCEKYRLKEKGAILNWFDITEIPGYFSLNDKIGDILATKGGQMLFSSIMKGMLTHSGTASFAGFEMSESMLQMMNGFTVIRLTNLLATAGITVTKNQLLDLNAQLNRIKKEN